MTEDDLARFHLAQQRYDKSQRFTAPCDRDCHQPKARQSQNLAWCLMNVRVIISDDFGFLDSREFNSLAAAAWYAQPFARIQSYVVIFRFQ